MEDLYLIEAVDLDETNKKVNARWDYGMHDGNHIYDAANGAAELIKKMFLDGSGHWTLDYDVLFLGPVWELFKKQNGKKAKINDELHPYRMMSMRSVDNHYLILQVRKIKVNTPVVTKPQMPQMKAQLNAANGSWSNEKYYYLSIRRGSRDFYLKLSDHQYNWSFKEGEHPRDFFEELVEKINRQ
jgi:hypothetical protein